MSTNAVASTSSSSAFFAQSTNGNQSSDDNGSDMGTRGANYFFGFLIAFVILLLIFIGCGVGSRRRYLARRNAMVHGGYEPWGTVKPEVAQKKPALHEKFIGAPIFEDEWKYTMPLSVTLLRRPKTPQSEDPDLEAQQTENTDNDALSTSTPPSNRSSLTRELQSWITPFHDRKLEPPVESDETEYGSPEALGVAVMIAMPSSPPASSNSSQHRPDSANETRMPEYQIGTTSVPWHSELLTLTTNSMPDPPQR